MSNSLAYVAKSVPGGSQHRERINALYHADESAHVKTLLEQARLSRSETRSVHDQAVELVRRVRARKQDVGAMEAFMQEYDLSSEEGVVLMCLAEALLRVPDADTAEKLIADKLSDADWESHLGKSQSLFVNASTWGLMLTGKLVNIGSSTQKDFRTVLGRLANKSGEPVVRLAIRRAMRIMGHQYVMGRTIVEALERSAKKTNRAYRYSFDMLGEAALTAVDAERYLEAYRRAIKAIGKHHDGDDIYSAPSISVKLSALHPRYEYTQRERVMRELPPRLLELARMARERHIALTVDAEEADRLLLSLDVFATVFRDDSLARWSGLGLALQAYQKRAVAVVDWLSELAREKGRRIPIRLVKGAYWDTEVKHSQVEGFGGYPVFTRKSSTDISYIACAKKLLADRQAFYPQFATHNAHTICVIATLAGDRLDYEFQRLHGMGEDLYFEVMQNPAFHHACRVYAPVGSHEDLLPYLVRRLLENGANTSFVNRIVDENLPVEKVAEDPIANVEAYDPIPHPQIALPRDIYRHGGVGERVNSAGFNLANELELARLADAVSGAARLDWTAEPLLAGERKASRKPAAAEERQPVYDPSDYRRVVGHVINASSDQVDQAVAAAHAYADTWERTPVEKRAKALDRAADLLEQNSAELMAICAREAGKTVLDSIAEVREAVDFCRYYAEQARHLFGQPVQLPGPTGESNQLSLHGRGVFACISPWNFPLAIYLGQVTAALAAGNTVVAKPAEQTPIIAHRAAELLYQAGIPRRAFQLLPGDGTTVGAHLTGDPRIAGVAFTGSTETARLIARSLAARDAPLATLIAETGGQNAMLVDSSALPEQVVTDVIGSAFLSAGQRCSALRVLFLQRDIADRVVKMLAGAMQELIVGDPALLQTDIGPVIDQEALQVLEKHALHMDRKARLIAKAPLDAGLSGGHFFAPRAYEIRSIDQLQREVFGPVLHVVRYRSQDIDKVIDAVNATGYGLTMGVHSRIDRVQRYVTSRIKAGNAYVNRTMTGAVVGVQPFGGEGLSGTGPKAGGPHYLLGFATERTLTVNTAAVGGNASLLALNE